MTIGINEFIFSATLLFLIGFMGVVFRRNTLVVYMSLELMLNAVNLALVAFSRYNQTMDGAIFVFFIIIFVMSITHIPKSFMKFFSFITF